MYNPSSKTRRHRAAPARMTPAGFMTVKGSCPKVSTVVEVSSDICRTPPGPRRTRRGQDGYGFVVLSVNVSVLAYVPVRSASLETGPA